MSAVSLPRKVPNMRSCTAPCLVGSSVAELDITSNFNGRETPYTARVKPDLHHRQIANHFEGSSDGVVVGGTLDCLARTDVSITLDAINSVILHSAFPLASTGDTCDELAEKPCFS